jgi:hypothetical protein
MKILNFTKVLATVLMIICSVAATQAQTIHAIVCGGTNIKDIGSGCAASVKLITEAIDYIGVQTDMDVNLISLVGDDFTKANIAEAIENLNPAADDVIWFYSTSHGFNYDDRPSDYTFFLAHPTLVNDLSLTHLTKYGMSLEADVKNVLKAKNARLTLVMGEACNNSAGVDAPNRYNAMNTNIGKRLKELFLYAKGTIISCSSQYDEYSWTDPNKGGIYTNMFIHAMNMVIEDENTAKWHEVFDKTKEYVEQANPNGRKQTPIYYIDTSIKLKKSGRAKKMKKQTENSPYKSCSTKEKSTKLTAHFPQSNF